MKDSQGVERKQCLEDCDCVEYQKIPTSNACDYCGHYPTKHQAATKPASSPSPSPSSSSSSSFSTQSSSSSSSSTPRPSPASSIKPSPSPSPAAASSIKSSSSPSPSPASSSKSPSFVMPRQEQAISTPHTAVSSRPSPTAEKPMKNPVEWFKDKTKKKKA